MKHFKLFLLLFFAGFSLSAQTIIKGTAKGYEGRKIKLITYADYFTYRENEIAAVKIDSIAGFQFSIDLDQTAFCLLKTGNISAGIYLEPNTSYDVTFPEIDTISSYYLEKEHYVNIAFQNTGNSNLNQLIIKFNQDYDKFVADHIQLFIRKTAGNKVDTFCNKVVEVYQKFGNSYLNDYVSYNLAMLKFSATNRKKELYDEYLRNKPVLYRNDAYMQFINLFYADYFKTMPVGMYDKVIEAVNVKMNRDELMRMISNEKYLEKDSLKELVLIRALYESFHHPELKEKSILYTLKEIESTTTIEQHKEIVSSVITKLSGVEKGSFAPDFELTDVNGKVVKLSDIYKKKYVYLDFWATWCQPCVKEMKLIAELHKIYGDEVEFISISIDRNSRVMKKFVDKHNYNWTIIYYDDNEELKKAYKVGAIPLYYFIAPGGMVIQSPAMRPSRMEPYFRELKR